MIADGLREQLVYAVEHRYVDVVVASADDLFADLYESLGHAHSSTTPASIDGEAGREETLAYFASS